MNCEISQDDFVAYLKGELPPSDAGRVETHLATCPTCAEERDQVRRTLDTVGTVKLPEFTPSPDLFAEIRNRIQPAVPAARPSRFPVVMAFAASVAAVLFLAIALFAPRRAAPACERFLPVFGAERVHWQAGHRGSTLRATPGQGLPTGQTLTTDGDVRLQSGENVSLVLRDGDFRIRDDQLFFQKGLLAARVKPGTPFSMATPHGTVTVHGTRFIVRVTPHATRVTVLDGCVALSGSGEPLLLERGRGGTLGDGAPKPGPYEPAPGMMRLLDAKDLLLRLSHPDPSRPGLLEFTLTNISATSLLLPAHDPDRPRYLLKVKTRASDPGGVINLGEFHTTGSRAMPSPRHGVVLCSPPGSPPPGGLRLEPGGEVAVRFDASGLFKDRPPLSVQGVFQVATAADSNAWTGQVASGTVLLEPEE